ncbi:MAG: M24 family metallopeptidase [bacterium]
MRATIEQIQEKLSVLNLQGWLLYIWRTVNPVAITTLGLEEEGLRSRRCYYLIPAKGEPRKLLHVIEPHSLEGLPGNEESYSSYVVLKEKLAAMLKGYTSVAMEYSPECHIPTASWVDAGTVEMIRSLGVSVVSSAELVQYFEATLDDAQIASHFSAAELCKRIAADAFEEAGKRIRDGKPMTEYELQQWIVGRFNDVDLIWESNPIIGVNGHSSDPHYSPSPTDSTEIKAGDVLLIDLWAKGKQKGAVYADQTWMGYFGVQPPEKVKEIWELVRDARRAGYALVTGRIAAGKSVYGYEVDDASRAVIEKAGYGEYFFHRTGHSITWTDHGNGANMDNLETHDDRPIIPRTCFSIEPGVYLPEFGVRSENNVMILPDGTPKLAEGTDQEELILVTV